jgi:hypothetical protein
MDEGPEREAAAKLAQHLAVAVQVAEAVIRLQAQRAETRAAGHAQAAAAGRAERTAQHAADRVVWSRALDPRRASAADLADLGRAWGAAAGWADTDPTADVAARRVEARLAEMAPTAMTRFDRLRAGGLDRTAAMRDVLGHLAAESSYRPRVFVAEPGPAAAGADARIRTDTAAAAPRRSQPTPDQPATSRPDQPAAAAAATDRQVRYIVDLLDRSAHRADRGPTDPASIATLDREQASAYIEALGGGASRRTTAAGHRTPATSPATAIPTGIETSDRRPRPARPPPRRRPPAAVRPASAAARHQESRSL